MGDICHYSDGFLRALNTTGSVLSGMRVLYAMTSSALEMAPNVLEIYTCPDHTPHIIRHLSYDLEQQDAADKLVALKIGFEVDQVTREGDAAHTARWGEFARTATYLKGKAGQTTDGLSVIIVESNITLSYAPVYSQPTTALLGFWSLGLVWHPYPRFMWGKNKKTDMIELGMMHNHGRESLTLPPISVWCQDRPYFLQKIHECEGEYIGDIDVIALTAYRTRV